MMALLPEAHGFHSADDSGSKLSCIKLLHRPPRCPREPHAEGIFSGVKAARPALVNSPPCSPAAAVRSRQRSGGSRASTLRKWTACARREQPTSAVSSPSALFLSLPRERGSECQQKVLSTCLPQRPSIVSTVAVGVEPGLAPPQRF